MTDVASMTKAELIEELLRLRKHYEECSSANGGNGKFDEDALFALAEDAEGDEIFLVTETGRFVYVNDTALDLLGYSESEMLAMAMPAIDPDNSRAAWLGRVSRLKQTGERDVFETAHVAKDGSLQTKEISAQYVTYASRNYVLCIGNRVERTEEQRTAAAPAKSREKVFMQTTSDGVLVVDTRGTIIESNSAADRLLGVAKSEIIGRSCVDSRWRLVDSDGSPLSISNHPLMITLVEEQPLTNRRINMLAQDGSRRMLMINASPQFDESGTLTGAIGCIRPYEDSVERKEQQRRDTRQNALYRDVVQALLSAGSEDDLERQVCDALVRHGDYALVWRGVTKETDERIHPTVSAGDAADYLMKIKVRYDDSEYGNGPHGRAMKSRKTVVVPDLSADASYAPWKNQAERTGLHSLAAFPLHFDGKEEGLLTIYSRDRNPFVGTELERLTEIAGMLAHGIGIRRQLGLARGARAEADMQRAMLAAYNSILPVAVAYFDRREPFRCEAANKHYSELIDEPYHSTGVEGTFVSDFMYASYQRDIYQQMLRASSAEEAIGEDNDVFTDWQGNEMHWSWRIQPVTGDAGQDQLLYVAYRLDRQGAETSLPEDSPAVAPALAAPVTAAPSRQTTTQSASGPALMRLAVPRFGSRTKPETRFARFMDEGQILQANAAAMAMFLKGEHVLEAEPQHVFGPETRELLEEILVLKDSGETLSFSLQGKQHSCQVFIVPGDEMQQYLLVCE